MKDKIFIFIIGLLIGAIITASGFLIFEKNNTKQMPNKGNMQMMERPERPSNSDGLNFEKTEGTPPADMQNGETPPEKPDESNNKEKESKNSNTKMNKNRGDNNAKTNNI